MRTVPEHLRRCTPVAVKATAGLRLLGAAQSGEILEAVRSRLKTAYPFPLSSSEGPEAAVAIMDGRDEGVFAWVTANYLLDTIRADSPREAVPYAVLDLGGASTQIVFEPVFGQETGVALGEGEHRYELSFGGEEHVLYQHSYLGYGLMRARKSVHRLVDFRASLQDSSPSTPIAGADAAEVVEIANPCLARGTSRVVEVEVAGSEPAVTRKVNMVGKDVGDFEACNDIMQLIMAKDAACPVKPCSFNGVYQPSLLETFPNGKILLLSYFYDRIHPLLPPSTSSPPLTVSSLADLARDVCGGRSAWEKRWAGNQLAMDELADRPEYCLDLTYMHTLLRSGYEFGDERQVEIGKRIEGTELGWALGAAIAMVGGELTCTA